MRAWMCGAIRLVAVAAGCVAAARLPAADDAPRLLLNAADIARINARAAAEPWLAAERAALLEQAADWPAAHIRTYGLQVWAPPAEGGGWGGHYICPEDGAALQFAPGHNRCPRCGRDYHGWPYDYVIFTRRHGDNARAVRNLGLAYRLSGDAEFAAKARDILLAYAAIYPGLPIRSHKDWPAEGHGSGGRVTSQTLNEADWVGWLAFGYDLIRETLPAAERARIERDLLRNASDVVARRGRSLGNWTVRHNAAHLAVGLVLRDQALIDLAVNAEFGFRDELRRGVTREGPWSEGSWGYHFYTMDPLFLLAEMTARAGLAVPELGQLRKMLDAPLACMLPDGTLPNFNDSHFTAVRAYARFYDIGFRLFGDRRYLRVVREGRRGLEAMLWGAADVDAGELPELTSNVLPEAGLATLRAAGADHTIAIKFGAHGGGHGHFDKLNFVSFAHGRLQAVDPGTQSYAFKTHATWDKVTLAHNTIVVDETTQAEATGRLLAWHTGDIATAIRVDAGPVYPHVRCERLLVHTAGYALDVLDVAATDGATHRYDWIYHNAGRVSSPLATEPASGLPADHGYQHLSAARAATTSAGWEATFVQDGTALRLQMLGADGTTVVLGEGLGQDLTVPVPFAMARRRGPATRFITVLEPFATASDVRRLRLEQPGVIVIETSRGVDRIDIAPGHFNFARAR